MIAQNPDGSPTHMLIEIDLVQAEWVVTAYFAKELRMIQVLQSKQDPHVITGCLISGAPRGFVEEEDAAIGHLTDPTDIAKGRAAMGIDPIKQAAWLLPRTMTIRQAGKKSNHGLNYNMGYRRFATETEMDEKDSLNIHSAYHDAYPGLRLMYKFIEAQLRTDRTLTNCFGHKRRFLDQWGPDLLDAAYAFTPQSTVATITNIGMRDMYKDRTKLDRWEILANGHDSVTSQAFPRSWGHLSFMVEWASHYMGTTCAYHGRDFTIAREIKIGPNWGIMQKVKMGGDLENSLRSAWADAEAKANRLDGVVP